MCGIKQNSFQHWSSKVIVFNWKSLSQSCLQRHQQEEISILEPHTLFLCDVCWAGTETWVHNVCISGLLGELAYGQSRCSWWKIRVNEKVYFLCREGSVRRRHSRLISWDPPCSQHETVAYTSLALAAIPPSFRFSNSFALQQISLE